MVLADRSHKVMCRAIGCHHLTLKRVLKFMDRQAEMIANAIYHEKNGPQLKIKCGTGTRISRQESISRRR